MPKASRRESHILVKGNFLVKGPVVQPAVLAALNPLPANAPADRMGLAEWFIDPNNPLTARVAGAILTVSGAAPVVDVRHTAVTTSEKPNPQAMTSLTAPEKAPLSCAP